MNSFFESGKDATYSSKRNYDLGRDNHSYVSMLSPYTRYRIILESELAELTSRSDESNEKFLKEVYWRTYWKGYLANFPSIWDEYKELCSMDLSAELSSSYEKAINAETQFDVFNDWVKELKETGYLHNHARMWFASIWIHTLELPWFLGADFFLKHLLDGDEAVNTLSWRWVAGLQTRGKSYLATKSNIHKFTDGRCTLKDHVLAKLPVEHTFLDYPPNSMKFNEMINIEWDENTGLLVTCDGPGAIIPE